MKRGLTALSTNCTDHNVYLFSGGNKGRMPLNHYCRDGKQVGKNQKKKKNDIHKAMSINTSKHQRRLCTSTKI